MTAQLMTMQEPVVQQPMLNERVHQSEEDSLFYKFETCSLHTYYIEVEAWYGSLLAAIAGLKSDFGADASGWCRGCDAAFIQKIEIVPLRDVPEADENRLVFVSRLER